MTPTWLIHDSMDVRKKHAGVYPSLIRVFLASSPASAGLTYCMNEGLHVQCDNKQHNYGEELGSEGILTYICPTYL